jgi:UDP-N-acetylmuramate--alanine ligase
MEGQHAHLLGICGNGMRALANVLSGWGWSVSGSDLSLQGHAAENLPADSDVVIFSDAIPPENPEICRARELGIPRLSYFQALGKITSGIDFQPVENIGQVGNPSYVTLAVAGTHGKSTTTAMIAHLLSEAEWNPTVFCGAAPLGKNSGGRAGRKDLFVVEACEYRKNFLHLHPRAAVISGIEPDHFDCYEQISDLEEAFRQFAESLPAEGLLLYREDCLSTRKIIQNAACRKKSFGFSANADWSVRILSQTKGYYRISIFHRGEFLLDVQLPVPGRYNVGNALAAAAICKENGVSAEHIRHGLETFPPLKCRFEMIPEIDLPSLTNNRQAGSFSYIMDYAHHPTEVMAVLQTAREVFPQRRIWCIFQPHQASRTARLLDELAFSLQNADKIIVAEIFRAREGFPKPGEVTADDLSRRTGEIAKAGKAGTEVLPFHQKDDIIKALATQVKDGDVIITLGAGDIHTVLGLRS